MAKTAVLKSAPRQRTGSGQLKQMRREGWVPSVVYGGGKESKNLKIKAKEFKDLLSHSVSENILIDLQLEDGGTHLALLQDVQHNALTGEVLHVDFWEVDEKTEITAQIPVELIGEAAGVKMGGMLEQQRYNVDIKCLPKHLPELIEANVEHLQIGDALHIGEMAWPEGVSSTLPEDVVVAQVAKTRVAISEGAEEETTTEESAKGEDKD